MGGYFGGYLAAKKYAGSETVEIIFIARPATAEIISVKGLKLITPTEEKIIFPDIVSADPSKIGVLDCLICAVKSYDLEESLGSLKSCIMPHTLILPLLNGVDAKKRIKNIYRDNEVADGCVYIVSRLIEPGIIKETGNIHSLYFGSETAPHQKMKELEQLFRQAEIDCHLSENIESIVWEKFVFISSIASLTSYLDLNIGAILENDEYTRMLLELIGETKAVALAKGIHIPENIEEKTLLKLKSLPYKTTSSMHSDFQRNGQTEYRALTEYVAKEGKSMNVPTPVFEKILQKFTQ